MSPKSTIGSGPESILDLAVSRLEDSTGLQASVVTDESNGPGGIDSIAQISDGTKRWQFSAEVKSQLNSHTLGSAIAAVFKIQQEHGPTALIGRYINPSQAEKLRELEFQKWSE
jgi:hypothetical protein